MCQTLSPAARSGAGTPRSRRRCRTSPSGFPVATRRRGASAKARSVFAVVQPLVAMLPAPEHDNREAALLALLNLAAHNERNEDRIVKSHAVPHLVELLRSKKNNLRELATAAVLTLSASTPNKPTIATSGAVPLLVQILIAEAVKPLLTLLKDC
ncbi:U-box domain-containing protein [Musa troglodytarum]|uniref:U-box domain-containing protein n=1 Tax=Musa troglodytarum TaxID=320322 RepID=A0A9E7KN35_9LILI|nr:U-box domain-containing protein [Musa troglodytarum]